MMFRTSTGTVEVTPMLRTNGGLVAAGDAMFRDGSGLRSIGNGGPGGGGGGALTITVSPSSAYGARSSNSSTIVTTNEVTAAVTGGVAPYSFSWSSENQSVAAVNPTSASTRFRAGVGPGEDITDIFHCAVTDAHGAMASSGPVSVTVSNFGT